MRARMLGHVIGWGRCWCVACRDTKSGRDRARRVIKRRERQRWKHEVRR